MNPFDKPISEPMRVQPIDGEVVVLGPEALGMSLTPEAAEESGRRLVQAAQEARAQRDGA